MPADRRAIVVKLLCVTCAVAAAMTAGGCAAQSRDSILWAPPGAKVAMETQVIPPGAAPFDEAVALASELKYPQAETRFGQALVWFQAAGDKDRSAECTFWIGFCREKQGRIAEAREQYDKVIRDYSDTPAARTAAERMGRLPVQEAPRPAPPPGVTAPARRAGP